MASSGDDRRGFPKAVWGWIAAWVVLAILAVTWGVPNEENDLTDRATNVLSGTGLSVRFDGRDATITGSAEPTAIDAARDQVYNMRGVRDVDVSSATEPTATTQPSATTTTAPATTTVPPELPSPSLTAAFADGAVVLSGTMPSQAAIDTIATAAVDMYGPGNVTYEMAVDNVAEPAYLSVLAQVFGVADGLDPWNLRLADDRLTYSGMAPDAESVAAARQAFSDFTTATSFAGADVTVEVDPTAVAATLTDLLAGGANFETGSATLSAEAAGKLDEVIEIMLANPSTVLIVEGHTDSQGDAAANQALSEARAQAVVDYLVAGGVEADRLTAIGYGEERPIAENDTAEGRAMNRRIEFVVSEGE